MNKGKTVFSQIMEFMPLQEFCKCVKRYQGNYKIKSFSCLDQYLCMAFAQLTYRESLRDIESCLRSMKRKLYHMGIRGKISRNTLAYANETRDWRIYADFAQVVISIARPLYADDNFGIELNNTVYALDATIIDLCLSSFCWAKRINNRKRHGAIKLQTLLDLRGNIPTFIQFDTPGGADSSVLDKLTAEPGSFYIMDRGYMDTARLYYLHKSLSYFVVRSKNNIFCKRLYSHSVKKASGLKHDQTVVFFGPNTSKNYPEKLRRIRYVNEDNNIILLTNNFQLPALTITELYKCRWQVELFFKWIKQHLRIKNFYGRSFNAVKTQIWIAISVYVLLAIIKKKLKLNLNLYTILQILSVTVFEKEPLYQALTDIKYTDRTTDQHNELLLFDL